MTPFCADFIDYVKCDNDGKDISKLNKVIGFGTILHKLLATNCNLLYVSALSYHIPSANIHLFSPQAHHQLYGGSSELDGDKIVMPLSNSLICPLDMI